MPIWKCAAGGYHSGKDCYEEFGQLLKHVEHTHDVQLVRVVPRDELMAALSKRYSQQFFDEDVDAILETLLHLTPEGTDKKAWEKLHGKTKQ